MITVTYIPYNGVYGLMPFGGNPVGKYMVAILYKGAFHFDLTSKDKISPDYAAEKLGLSKPDSEHIAELLNYLSEFIKKGG